MNLKEKCKELDYDYRKALILYASLPFQDEGVLDILREYDEDYDDMLIALCTTNKNKIEGLYINKDNWKEFKTKINLNHTSSGHKDNPREGNLISYGKEVESIFNVLNMEYDVDKIVNVITNYYKEGIYKRKLQDYLRDNFEADVEKEERILMVGRSRN
jgi:hypothetical protein